MLEISTESSHVKPVSEPRGGARTVNSDQASQRSAPRLGLVNPRERAHCKVCKFGLPRTRAHCRVCKFGLFGVVKNAKSIQKHVKRSCQKSARTVKKSFLRIFDPRNPEKRVDATSKNALREKQVSRKGVSSRREAEAAPEPGTAQGPGEFKGQFVR